MNSTIVARTLSLIPDRVPRMQTGTVFDPSAPCAHPERIAHLLQFLTWLGPLHPVTKDDLRILGLLTPYGKPAIAIADEDADEDALPLPDALPDEIAAAIPPVVAEPSSPQIEATLP